MSAHKLDITTNEIGSSWRRKQRSPRAWAWRSRSAFSVAVGIALVVAALGVVHHGRHPERDQPPPPIVAPSVSSGSSGHAADAARPLAAAQSSQPAKAGALAASPGSSSRSAPPALSAPKRERSTTAAGASAPPFPNLSFSAFTLPNDFAHTGDPAGDGAPSRIILPDHDFAPSLNPGLPNHGATSGSSPNPALMNNPP